MISKTVLRWLTLVALVGLSLGVMVPAASAAFVGTEITACSNTPLAGPGSYFLKHNLTATGTDCIRVESSHVAIDMNGHTITGDGAHRGITDDGVFVESVAIANGKIKDFDDGIDFFGFIFCCESSDLITIEKVEVTGNKAVGIDIEGCCNNFTEIKASNNGDAGLVNPGCCSLFDKVTANNNGDDGVDVEGCCSTASNITANGNAGQGILMEGDDNGLVNAKANDNKFAGIDILDFDNQVSHSTANNNGADGIEFGGGDNEIADSVANNNKIVGIDLGNNTFNTVTDVTANHNGTDGVALKCPSNAVKVSAHNNTGTQLDEITPALCTNLDNKAP